MTTAPTRGDLYARVTAQIVAALESGPGPFVCPWHRLTQPPHNATTGRPYRGLNTVLLWVTSQTRGYSSPAWASFNQWAAQGCPVRKGEKASHILFWKPRHGGGSARDGGGDPAGTDAATPSGHAGFIARTYAVFNANQVQGGPADIILPLNETERDARAERFFDGLPIAVRHGGDRAYYHPASDSIQLPPFTTFRDAGGYYAVRAHETIHASGAPHRLDRNLTGRFGSAAYAMEELVAELGAAFICASLGLAAEPRPDHAAYLATWLKVLREDSRAIFTAASAAQKAADWLQAAGIRAAPLLSPAA